MKPSEMPKNKRDSVRVNKDVDAHLRSVGSSVQKMLDWAIDQNVKIDMKMKSKDQWRKLDTKTMSKNKGRKK